MAVAEKHAPAPWSATIRDQLAETDVPATAVYAVVAVPVEGHPFIVEEGFSATETGAVIVQEDWRANSKPGAGDILVVKLADLREAADEQAAVDAAITFGENVDEAETIAELEAAADDLEAQLDAELEADPTPEDDFGEAPEGTASGEDPDAGKLFEVPRVKVAVDESDPTILKLAFSGSVELDRTVAADVDFYNRLRAGQTVALEVEAHVAGAKTTHRRDSDGFVDAVVQTKTLKVHSAEAE